MYKKKLRIILSIYFLVLILLGVRVYFLQIKPSQMVQGELQNNQEELISSVNFNVLDSNNNDLLSYKKRHILVIDSKPFKLNNYEETLQDLLALNFIMKSEYDDFNYTEIMSMSGKMYYDISKENYDKIEKLKNIKGIYCYEAIDTDIKEGWRIENIISNVQNEDAKNIKQDSFEENINSIVEKNEYPMKSFYLDQKSIYNEGTMNDLSNNNNIKLTIDSDIENKIREVLNKDEYSFLKNIGVVLLESNTGKIKAMVQKDESEANINLGIAGLGFEPGSIFKLLTTNIGLDLGYITNSTVFNCSGEICMKDGKSHGHGDLTVNQALEISCNDISAKIGELIGYEDMIKYTTQLGFYEKVLGLSIENKEEAIGIKPKKSDGVSNFSIGQSVTVTPLQIAGAINAISNNGIYVKPYIVDSIVNNENKVIKEFRAEEKKVFGEVSTLITKEMMTDVINVGSGYEAKVEDVIQGGKTGTAQGVGGKTNHGWFAGYFELNNVTYTLVISAPNIANTHPDGRELGGGNTGAPIFRDIINKLK